MADDKVSRSKTGRVLKMDEASSLPSLSVFDVGK